jgi:membrane protease YdiL (CAAX protease family)
LNGTGEVSARRVESVPPWHPLLLVALMLSVAIAGLVSLANGGVPAAFAGSRITGAYVPMLAVSWGLFLYVCRVGRSRSAFVELAGLEGYSPRRAWFDVPLALLVAVALVLGELAWQFAFGGARSARVDALLPVTETERAVWCVVALSAALTEEVVYRGYLRRELSRLTGRPVFGVVAQAVLFALAHGEQGSGAMLRYFAYAVGLALLAQARGSLVPGILGHAAVDLAAGLAH